MITDGQMVSAILNNMATNIVVAEEENKKWICENVCKYHEQYFYKYRPEYALQKLECERCSKCRMRDKTYG